MSLLPLPQNPEAGLPPAAVSAETLATMNEAVERLAAALRQIAEAISAAVARWLDNLVMFDRRLFLPWHEADAQAEAAYRAYARAYNWRHAGRRVSWRRLNRVQRAAALKAARHE